MDRDKNRGGGDAGIVERCRPEAEMNSQANSGQTHGHDVYTVSPEFPQGSPPGQPEGDEEQNSKKRTQSGKRHGVHIGGKPDHDGCNPEGEQPNYQQQSDPDTGTPVTVHAAGSPDPVHRLHQLLILPAVPGGKPDKDRTEQDKAHSQCLSDQVGSQSTDGQEYGTRCCEQTSLNPHSQSEPCGLSEAVIVQKNGVDT